MPDFNPASLKGHDAVDKAQTKGGKFSPWIPQFIWKDGEEKFLLIISPASEFYTVDLHEFIEVGEAERRDGSKYTKYEQFISRHTLGEKFDKLSDELERVPRQRTLAVAVELEPKYETVRGRQRFAGATVKTETFTRKTDDGDVEVEAPVVGILSQAQKNFFGYVISFDRTRAPSHEIPFGIQREGSDSETQYHFTPFMDSDVDLSGLLDNLGGIGYLGDDAPVVAKSIENAEDDISAAAEVGTFLLEKRFEELADANRYEEFIGPIDELPPARFAGGRKKEDSSKSSSKRAARPARTSPRQSSNGDGDGDTGRSKRFANLRAEVEEADQVA